MPMPKRPAELEDGSPPSKRQRFTKDRSGKTTVNDIVSANQLQGLLAFSQDAGPDTKQSIHTFKLFLESLACDQDAVLQSSRTEILLEYFKLQSISQRGDGSGYALDLVKTWSFAAQSNNEALFAAVASVLALLLKTISHRIEFRDYGRNVCHLLLQRDHLKLFEKGLSAQKSKDHLISPCLRLLTEIVSFDGGSSAKRLYRSKDITFKRLDTFLTLRQDVKAAASSSRRKPSLRNLALRYFFANLRLQDPATKIDILGNARLLRSVFQDLKADSPWIIREILGVTEADILKDEKVPRRIKGRLFTDQLLSSIATLYGYHDDNDSLQDGDRAQTQKSIPASAHAFLLSICTTPEYGILIEKDRRYSAAEGEEDDISRVPDYEGLELFHKRAFRPKAMKNHVLASFLQTLRPYANDMQRDLTLAIFQAAPELISDYFRRKKSFSLDPKLTATWVGFVTFLLSTINLPVDERMLKSETHGLLAASVPDIIESILPMPLSPMVTSRCLNQNVSLIKLLANKVLSAAFDKFAQVLSRFDSSARRADTAHDGNTRDSVASSLTEKFSQRCPDMSQVITVFRSCTPQDVVLREASARLLSLYYRHLPQTALEQKFDASVALSTAFETAIATARRRENPTLEPLVLEHLITVAKCSPDIRWWQKSGTQKLSLFGSGLRLRAIFVSGPIYQSLEALLQIALIEGLSVESKRGRQLLALALGSLTKTKEWEPTETLFEFLDDCFARLPKRAVKYHQDLLKQAAAIHHHLKPVGEYLGGELLMVVMEQWPFMQESAKPADLENITCWLSRFLLVAKRNGVDPELLEHIRSRMKSITSDKECRKLLKGSFKDQIDDRLSVELEQPDIPALPPPMVSQNEISKQEQDRGDVWTPPTPPGSEDENHPGLGKWKQLEVEEAIVEGAIGDLVLCLCSKFPDIRKQALNELRAWMKKLQASQHSEREPLYLLTGELVETANTYVADEALLYFAGVAAAEFYQVLSKPLHNLYAKVNRFLNRAPTWKIEKMPSYWVDQVLMHLPANDDGHYKEMGWLLDLLIGGLRTNADMELYRRSHILERLLALLASPSLQPSYQEKVLTLLFRCSYAGGSTTLITRYGLVSWVQCMIGSGVTTGSQAIALEQLVQHCIASCDRERVHGWSGGNIIGTSVAEQINGAA